MVEPMGNVTTEKLTSAGEANEPRIAQIDKTLPFKLLQIVQLLVKVVVEVDAEVTLNFSLVNFKPGENMILDEFVPQMIVVVVSIRFFQIDGYLARIDHPEIIFDACYCSIKAFIEKAYGRGAKAEVVQLVIL
jgi:hypothetical protein